jgi:two-component system, LytTR family, sensor histidine kinase AlgZ
MHPIFASPRRLGFYLLGTTPFAALLTFLLHLSGQLTLAESAGLAFPFCLIYSFDCLSAWYICRVTPLHNAGAARIISTHGMAALAASALMLLIAQAIARLIGISPARLGPQLPLLFGTGVLGYLLSVASHYVLLALEASRAAERREAEARLLAGDAELRALKAQINPHFLYNSLNSISALSSVDPARARHMCILLSDFLRSTLGMGERQSIPLNEEFELLHRYLAIEKIRFGERLGLEESIAEDCLQQPVPPLLLQPLVENAVIHGIANVIENGLLRLTAARTADRSIAITIENTFDPDAPPPRRKGFGQANVRKRLQSLYGNRAGLRASAEGDRYRVEITLPAGENGRA